MRQIFRADLKTSGINGNTDRARDTENKQLKIRKKNNKPKQHLKN